MYLSCKSNKAAKLIIFILPLLVFLGISCSRPTGNNEQKTGKDQHTAQPAEQQQVDKKQNSETTVNLNMTNVSPDTVKGKWLRPDGNYMLEITGIGDNGQLNAAYYNPNPINISTAQVKNENVIRIFIEFDDVNYKGSHYNLEYDLENDVLKGTYYQATYGQTYPIAFIRYEE